MCGRLTKWFAKTLSNPMCPFVVVRSSVHVAGRRGALTRPTPARASALTRTARLPFLVSPSVVIIILGVGVGAHRKEVKGRKDSVLRSSSGRACVFGVKTFPILIRFRLHSLMWDEIK